MAKEYIERTEELILAVNAGARAIENNKRYHGTIYNIIDAFSDKPREIPYLKAAEVLRSINEIHAADVVEVVRCKDCKYHKDTSVKMYAHCCLIGQTVSNDDFCSYGERRDRE